MNVSLSQAAAAMRATDRWQEVIAQNLAAASMPGFKKQEVSFASVAAGLNPTAAGQSTPLFPGITVATNFIQGQLKHTGVTTDVAIDGAGFFEVQLPSGETAYTRDGEFQVNAQGQLVTKLGYNVVSDGGSIQIDRNNPSPVSISADGTVAQGSDVKGKLKLTDFNNPHLLRAISNSYFTATDPNLVPADATGTRVRQGFLELGNVSAVAEMAHLITAMRQFEANQRLIQVEDDRMGRAISELGNANG